MWLFGDCRWRQKPSSGPRRIGRGVHHAPLIAHELRRQVRVIVERDLGARVAENLRERVEVPALHGEMRRALLLARRFGGLAPYLVGTDSDSDRSLPVGTGEQSHLTEHWR